MPKINQEEYEILKKLDDKWKWIARDENRGLYAFTKKPVRKDGPSSYWWDVDGWDAEPYAALGLVDEIHLFQFIQWEDEEPYNIAELIREYEKHEFVKINHEGQERLNKLFGNESEEKEMKDIEWLRKEFDDLFNGKSILTVGKSVVDEIINQLDEPETLSQEWIEEHKESWKDLSVTGYSVPEKDLQNLLVPKQDVPVIPQFVADFIKARKDTDAYTLQYILSVALNREESESLTKEYDWIAENDELFAQAWLAYPNVEIEQEPKYYICLPNMSGEKEVYVWYQGKTSNYYTTNNRTIREVAGNKIQFTEQEIKDYDERYWAFAEPVEELKE